MKKIILKTIFSTVIIYVCLAFVTIEGNPFLWSENLRIIFVCSLLFLSAALNEIDRQNSGCYLQRPRTAYIYSHSA